MYDFDYIRSVDTETISWLTEQMMKSFQIAVNFLNSNDRESANYYEGMGKGFKMILEEKFDFRPEQEIEELDDLLIQLGDG